MTGNGLAVVHDADAVQDAAMHALARETKLSETSFLQSPDAGGADYRHRIEALELPLLDGDGTLRVTASFGAASLAHSPSADKDSLVAAADAALYRAKRSGKNRTVRAE